MYEYLMQFRFRCTGEGLSMSSFCRLNECHLKELGFRMGDRVTLLAWTSQKNGVDLQSQQLQVESALPTTSDGHQSATSSIALPSLQPQEKSVVNAVLILDCVLTIVQYWKFNNCMLSVHLCVC